MTAFGIMSNIGDWDDTLMGLVHTGVMECDDEWMFGVKYLEQDMEGWNIDSRRVVTEKDEMSIVLEENDCGVLTSGEVVALVVYDIDEPNPENFVQCIYAIVVNKK